MCQLRIGRNVSAVVVPRGVRGASPTRGAGTSHQREEPPHLAVKTSGDPTVCVRGGLLESLVFSYKDLPSCMHLPWALVGGARDTEGETELSGFRMRAESTAAIVPVLSPPPTQPNLNTH